MKVGGILKTKQINARLDTISYNLLNAIVEETGDGDKKGSQSEIMRKALVDYAIKILGESRVQKIMLDTYTE